MDYFSIWHWMIVIAIVLLLFGRGKVSDLMADLAQGVKAFKKGIADDGVTGEGKTKVEQVASRQAEDKPATATTPPRTESVHS
jgi:sec-independent protein translocase protein TatA